MVLHAHDVCTGLDLAFTPPPELCRRLRDHTRDWPAGATARTSEPWSDLLEGSGRARGTEPRRGRGADRSGWVRVREPLTRGGAAPPPRPAAASRAAHPPAT